MKKDNVVGSNESKHFCAILEETARDGKKSFLMHDPKGKVYFIDRNNDKEITDNLHGGDIVKAFRTVDKEKYGFAKVKPYIASRAEGFYNEYFEKAINREDVHGYQLYSNGFYDVVVLYCDNDNQELHTLNKNKRWERVIVQERASEKLGKGAFESLGWILSGEGYEMIKTDIDYSNELGFLYRDTLDETKIMYILNEMITWNWYMPEILLYKDDNFIAAYTDRMKEYYCISRSGKICRIKEEEKERLVGLNDNYENITEKIKQKMIENKITWRDADYGYSYKDLITETVSVDDTDIEVKCFSFKGFAKQDENLIKEVNESWEELEQTKKSLFKNANAKSPILKEAYKFKPEHILNIESDLVRRW